VTGVIVLIVGEGQLLVDDAFAGRLNELHTKLEAAIELDDVVGFKLALAELRAQARSIGRPVTSDLPTASDLIVPPRGAAIDVTRRMLASKELPTQSWAWFEDQQPARAPSPSALPDLMVRTKRSEHQLEAGTICRIGRDPKSDIVMTDPRVSWRHCVVRVDGDVWIVEDLGSTNGTFLGLQRLDRIEISADCVVRLGNPDDGPVLRCMPKVPAASTAPLSAGHLGTVLSDSAPWQAPPVPEAPRDAAARGGSESWCQPTSQADPVSPSAAVPSPPPAADPVSPSAAVPFRPSAARAAPIASDPAAPRERPAPRVYQPAAAAAAGSQPLVRSAQPDLSPTGATATSLAAGGAVSYDTLVRSAFAETVHPGRLLFNPPDRMRLGQTERVEVRLARALTLDAELLEHLRGHGEPRLEEIPTAPLMAVTLKGDGFRIEAYSDEEQIVTREGVTTWEFDICALKRGQQRLVICVSLRIPLKGRPFEHKSIPVREATIDVQVGAPALVGHFVAANWQWFIGTAIAIAAVLVAVLH
jgi:hypothetical protein